MLGWIFGIIVSWIVAAIVLILVDRLEIGVHVESIGTAIVAAAVIAVLDVFLGGVLGVLVAPLNWITFGLLSWLFGWIINAIVLYAASKLTEGFTISKFTAALVAALVLSVASWALSLVGGALFG